MALACGAVGAQPAGAVLQPTYVSTLGGPGHAEIYPGGVDVDASGIVYVADTGNDRVVAYWPNGALKWTRGVRSTKKLLGNFDNPRDISYLNGRLYVADLGNKRVQVLDAFSGTPIEAWAVSFPSAIGITAGVDQNNHPVILVSVDTKNQISEFTTAGTLIETIGALPGGNGD